MNAPTDGRLTTRLAASLALAVYSGVIAISFVRVFDDWSFLGDMVLLLVVGHGISLLFRRVYLLVALPVQVAAMSWLVATLRYPDTLSAGLPSPRAWDVLTAELTLVREEFADAVAPVAYDEGWAAIAVLGLAVTVLLADVFAFRARTRFEALIPGGVLFVIVGALGSGRDQVLVAMLLVVAGVVAIATLRMHQLRPAQILVGRRPAPAVKVLAGALPVGVLAAAAAGAIGPALPGADGDALYEPLDGDGSTIRSPLVDIRSRLVDQSATELFRVDASQGAYWRLTTLSEFDGRSWKLPERTVEDTDEALHTPLPGSTVIRQNIEIMALGGRLVPAAAEPIGAEGRGLRWNQDSATLLTGEDGYSRGERFIVESAAPSFSPEQLAATEAREPPSDDFLELPDDLPDVVGDTAGRVTEGADSDYARARALQDWFRDAFTYSLEVQDGHDSHAIEAFLDRRVGYCEQFAGTFAAMARDLGMPARVAVGYTSGTRQDDGTFSVAGRNAHAWPEVWFDEFGWVPFEPTPGRGSPGDQEHTGVTPQQAPPDGETAESPAPPTTVEDQPAGSRPDAGDDNTQQEPSGPDTDDRPALDSEGVAGTDASAGSGGPPAALVVVLALVVIATVVAALPTLVRGARRRSRRDSPAQAIVGLWLRFGQLMAAGGVRADPSRTPSEFATVAARTAPGASSEIRSLAAALDRASYGPDTVDPQLVAQCEHWYVTIERSMVTLIPWSQRVWRHLTSWH